MVSAGPRRRPDARGASLPAGGGVGDGVAGWWVRSIVAGAYWTTEDIRMDIAKAHQVGGAPNGISARDALRASSAVLAATILSAEAMEAAAGRSRRTSSTPRRSTGTRATSRSPTPVTAGNGLHGPRPAAKPDSADSADTTDSGVVDVFGARTRERVRSARRVINSRCRTQSPAGLGGLYSKDRFSVDLNAVRLLRRDRRTAGRWRAAEPWSKHEADDADPRHCDALARHVLPPRASVGLHSQPTRWALA